jgi:hypothetical protein
MINPKTVIFCAFALEMKWRERTHYMLHIAVIWWQKYEFCHSVVLIFIQDDDKASRYAAEHGCDIKYLVIMFSDLKIYQRLPAANI